ncbi:hypothetical protein AB3X96_22080 [Paraburkholderia sp. BR13439]|uniref:hypothetical protein n=1 Tax=Paraburkholderia TaxID=1822464 RepID=UPI0034CD16D8
MSRVLVAVDETKARIGGDELPGDMRGERQSGAARGRDHHAVEGVALGSSDHRLSSDRRVAPRTVTGRPTVPAYIMNAGAAGGLICIKRPWLANKS